MFRLFRINKLADATKEMVRDKDLLKLVPVSIRYNNLPTYRKTNYGQQILPYIAHTSKIVTYGKNGAVIHEDYEHCSKISICLGSVIKLAESYNRTPEEFMSDVLDLIKFRLERGIDPTWNGALVHAVPNKVTRPVLKLV